MSAVESTPRERLSRLLVVLSRTRMFWRSTLIIAAAGLALSLLLALTTKRAYRSETTVLFRDAIQTRQGDEKAQRAARLGPTLKDLLYARPGLERMIGELGLFPDKAARSMMDAVEAMKLAIDFRARSADSFVISFTYEDPAIAKDVTVRLTARMIEEYHRQNLDTATSTQEFLHRELAEASASVAEASRALATFLARHPQFQWGLNDSPYAPSISGAPGTPLGIGGRPLFSARPTPEPAARGPQDPVLASLQGELAKVEARLTPPTAFGPPPSSIDAPKQRDAAAAALAAAEAALREKLATVTPAHPDAISAQAGVAAARRDLATAEAALRRARGGGAGEPSGDKPPPQAIDPDARADLVRQRDSLRRQIAELRRKLAASEPAPAAPAPSSSARKAPDVVDLETEWHRLRLELDRARDQLRLVQTNAHVADMAADAANKEQKEELFILEPAYLPTRPDRGRGRVFVVFAFVALFFAAGIALLRVLLNDTLLDEGDVLALGGPPALVSLPRIHAPPIGVASPRPDPPPSIRGPRPVSTALAMRGGDAVIEAEFDEPEVEVIRDGVSFDGALARICGAPPAALAALRVLRHRLEQKRGDDAFVVSVVSPGPGEGKTLLAARLAMTLSESDRARVVLVEGNLERPALAATLGLRLPARAGLSAQVRERRSGGASPWRVVRVASSLAILGEPDRDAADPATLHSTHFEAALGALRRSYEYVVIDGPAVLGSGDANVLEGTSDGVVMIVRAHETKGAALSRAVQQLGERRILGVVLNGV